MNNSQIVTAAREFARVAHRGQKDDDGKNHFLHCAKVVEILETITDDENLLAAGYLHDTVEDCGVTPVELAQTFNPDIAGLVVEVTKQNGGFPNLMTRRGAVLKFADRLHNLSRMDVWPSYKQRAYIYKSNFWGAK